MTTIGDTGEFAFIDRITGRFASSSEVIVGPGDDCAVLKNGDRTLLVTSDMSIEDVHFRRVDTRAEDIGWKAVAVSLSDIAAMGGQPRFVTIALAAPPDTAVALLEGIATGANEAAISAGAAIVGGDTTRSQRGLVIETTAIGEAPGGRYLRRSTAVAGDVLAVSGYPGDAGGGLHAQENQLPARELIARLHRPSARVREGLWLANHAAVHAMIDVSDGLGQDARHIAASSNLGVDLTASAIPISPELAEYCALQGLDAAGLSTVSGDAYELAFAIERDEYARIAGEFETEFSIPLSPVGLFSPDFNGLRIDGESVDAAGFEHFRRG